MSKPSLKPWVWYKVKNRHVPPADRLLIRDDKGEIYLEATYDVTIGAGTLQGGKDFSFYSYWLHFGNHARVTHYMLIEDPPDDPKEVQNPMHKHKAKKTAMVTKAFAGCVNPEQCNPAAHGNVTDAETCHCGWVREVNINQGHLEKSPWRAPGPNSPGKVPGSLSGAF